MAQTIIFWFTSVDALWSEGFSDQEYEQAIVRINYSAIDICTYLLQ
ncbi:MAG: hypothetical protein AB4372_39020 [Xenococcus sp. (in: cyanobacteria)]